MDGVRRRGFIHKSHALTAEHTFFPGVGKGETWWLIDAGIPAHSNSECKARDRSMNPNPCEPIFLASSDAGLGASCVRHTTLEA
jgi:hypothetical protein